MGSPMKSRTEVSAGASELLPWDAIAWARAQWRLGPRIGSTLFARSMMQDRRDGDLMFDSQSFDWTPETGKCTWWGNQMIDVGGAQLGKGLCR